MTNDIFTIKFLSDNNSVNWFQVSFNFLEEPNCYYNMIIEENNDVIYYANNISNNNWYNFDFNRFFEYRVKLLKFDGNVISMIRKEYFNFDNHNFNIIIRSDDENEIRIWKYYLWLLQIKYNFRFNILDNIFPEQNDGDYIEISRKAYDNYLKKCEKPLTEDYSSITIVRTLFGVLQDDSEIVNHPWLK